MKWVKRILLTLVVLIVLIIGISFFLPKQIQIERSRAINAKPEVVYGILNNLKTYDQWMPWNKLDPDWKVKYSDITVGKGASYSWESKNPDVGIGSLTIMDTKPNELVTAELAFQGMGNSMSGWKMQPQAQGTNVTWYMEMDMSKSSFFSGVMGKWMSTIGAMDKMLGEQFDKGLDEVKKLAESPEGIKYAGGGSTNDFRMNIDEKDMAAAIVITKSGKANSSAEISQQLGSIYQALGKCATDNGLKITFPPIAAYKTQQAPFDFWGGMMVDKNPAKSCDGIETIELPAKHAAVCHFYGPYELNHNGYDALAKWMKEHNKVADGFPIEMYMNDPTTVKPSEIQTDIVWPFK